MRSMTSRIGVGTCVGVMEGGGGGMEVGGGMEEGVIGACGLVTCTWISGVWFCGETRRRLRTCSSGGL